jgi:hypothetical protein
MWFPTAQLRQAKRGFCREPGRRRLGGHKSPTGRLPAGPRSPASPDWPDSLIARRDLVEEIEGLRHESGGDIMAHGGATFVQALSW